jgi:hypothetical protein
MARPYPSANPVEKRNAPGGKSSAGPEPKRATWIAPLTMIEPTASSMPAHSSTVSLPTAVICRYRTAVTSRPTAAASSRGCQGPPGREKVAGALRDADVAGAHLERPAQQKLPDDEKRQDGAAADGLKAFLQEQIAAARARHGGTQLAPDHAVANREERARQSGGL